MCQLAGEATKKKTSKKILHFKSKSLVQLTVLLCWYASRPVQKEIIVGDTTSQHYEILVGSLHDSRNSITDIVDYSPFHSQFILSGLIQLLSGPHAEGCVACKAPRRCHQLCPLHMNIQVSSLQPCPVGQKGVAGYILSD